MDNCILEIRNLSHYYDNNGNKTLDNINLKIKKNEFITLLGPSGCGKTTLIKILGGFLSQKNGEIYFFSKEISKTSPNKREINTVFQNYALFPHMNVFDNISFGLRMKKTPKDIIKEKVKTSLSLIGMPKYAYRNINELSGGQKQRVAIARAMVMEPKLLLLDEPLSALDLKMRQEMQKELKKIQRQLGITFIYVTHDQEEALTMSDRIVVMNEGIILQVGTPEEIYNEPKTKFVADFIGESNIFDGTYKKELVVSLLGYEFECLDKGFEAEEAVDLVIRPEDIKLLPKGKGHLSGIITSAIFQGVHYEMTLEIQKTNWIVQSTRLTKVGEEVDIFLEPDDIHVMHKE
ncbi:MULTISPECIES: ABC transporter ATP-binding protein [Borreliella]|uniref:Spermidine/putrescine import ATP-binding protein PotA n=3 Tax=Borreliella TaxID=64895 RepID=POTA_BORGP|nr:MULTISPECIES: ABC transporter ATP-binding protein [Borreliella]Q660M8.1 RecName: Full=Spermidine/putrescine import ATP-binding protein PotA [Borreliella bavariensis PBi]AAU07493.1 spermidine/putrescine ABC transporter, ATP-binding protein [Borreliella bavariensis PBi]AEW68976.1 PotA [Borreliella garinii BgVir]APQ14948.1 spermidine/putrescine ABC transporter ATP-binding protein [Borreliella garinii]AZA26515.1 spermidine/putrescine import ATP-binding protein PotA [Borreliella bavariensis PBi]